MTFDLHLTQFYDEERNSGGALSEFLADKVALVEKLFGENLRNVTKTFSVMGTSVIVIFIWGQWQLCLASLVIIPLLSVSIAARVKTAVCRIGS